MPTQQERRDSERVPCKLVCPFELTTPAGDDAVKLTMGSGHVINRSGRGMLLLLPEKVNKRQVVEIQVHSELRKEPSTKLVEVCWTRPISVDAQAKMYLAGTRFLFELPTPSQSPQTR
jgi:hypothetical protein